MQRVARSGRAAPSCRGSRSAHRRESYVQERLRVVIRELCQASTPALRVETCERTADEQRLESEHGSRAAVAAGEGKSSPRKRLRDESAVAGRPTLEDDGDRRREGCG